LSELKRAASLYELLLRLNLDMYLDALRANKKHKDRRAGADSGRRRRLKKWIDPNRAREILGRRLARPLRTASLNLHVITRRGVLANSTSEKRPAHTRVISEAATWLPVTRPTTKVLSPSP